MDTNRRGPEQYIQLVCWRRESWDLKKQIVKRDPTFNIQVYGSFKPIIRKTFRDSYEEMNHENWSDIEKVGPIWFKYAQISFVTNLNKEVLN